MSLNQRGRKLALTIENPSRRNINSSKQVKNLSPSINNENKEETSNELLSKILDTINSNSLNIFYPDSNSDFKKKIDSLNLKFYLETEKYLSNKNPSEKCQTSLFIILFKQINIYIEEIERLNLIIIKRKYEPKKIIERTDEIIKKQNEFLTKEKLIKTLKESKSYMETKLLESIMNEDKLKKEIQNLKKENAIFKKQLSKNNNTNNHMNINMQKKNSNYLLHKLTHQTFHSSTNKNLISDGNGIGVTNNKEKNDLYYNQGYENGANSKKRNNSDNNKTILNNQFSKNRKLLLFKNIKKNSEKNNIMNRSAITNNHNNILKNTQITSSNYLNKRPTIQIKLTNGNENINNTINNNNYALNSNSQTINNSVNFDFDGIKHVKTEFIINDLDEYKKGALYEYNSNVFSEDIKINKEINKDFRLSLCSKSKDTKIKNISEKENNINKKNKEKLGSNSSKYISNVIVKSINERKKKQKINI